ncbi:UxaA family hydrolase [Pantoea sp. 18069]|uniref:UxaA family hydrolase n=1 Tax=Pantoea sp. 18069 TaxID=2681415 RepID=UPI0013586532|nr:UxaA family hydrolase [Pantoea sp. 18069]
MDTHEQVTAARHSVSGHSPTDSFLGYPRDAGRAGTRNYIGVFIAGNCAATAARLVARHFTSRRLAAYPNVDGVLAFIHELGCGMEKSGEPMDLLRRTVGGTVRNPNLAGSVIMALGCERNNIYGLLEQEKLVAGPLLKTVVLQEVGGTAAAVEQGIAAVQAMLPLANAVPRQPVPVSELVLGLQTIDVDAADHHARQALGAAVDLLVAQGGTAIVSATTRNASALAAKASAPRTADALAQRVHWWHGYSAGRDVRSVRSETARDTDVSYMGGQDLQEVCAYAVPARSRGVVMMDSPGYEAMSVTGQVAAGATLVCLLTSAESALGANGAPTVRLAASHGLFARSPEEMDLDCSEAASGAMPVSEVGRTIYESWLHHASGIATSAENLGLGEGEFVPWPIGVIA